MVRNHSTKRMNRRWSVVYFYSMIDISAMNIINIWMKLQISLQCKKFFRCALLYDISKIICSNHNLLQPTCSETLFHPFVSCLRKYEKEKEMLLIPFEK